MKKSLMGNPLSVLVGSRVQFELSATHSGGVAIMPFDGYGEAVIIYLGDEPVNRYVRVPAGIVKELGSVPDDVADLKRRVHGLFFSCSSQK